MRHSGDLTDTDSRIGFIAREMDRKRAKGPRVPKPLLGFSHIERYWDPRREQYTAKILPGECYVTRHDEVVVTVLGSCVAACIRDPEAGVGGMNHFLLPNHEPWKGPSRLENDAARYGRRKMEHLVSEILRNGGERNRLEVKIFGGGKILSPMTDIGTQNIAFVCEYFRTEKLEVSAEDLGGSYARKVYYFPRSGNVLLVALHSLHNDTIQRRECEYLDALRGQTTAGGFGFF